MMVFKYYTYNFVDGSGELQGAYVARVFFWVNPLKVMDAVIKMKPRDDVFIVDLKRIK